jgi:hypothetical protein
VSAEDFPELMARYHRNIPEDAQDAMPPTLFVAAQRRASSG